MYYFLSVVIGIIVGLLVATFCKEILEKIDTMVLQSIFWLSIIINSLIFDKTKIFLIIGLGCLTAQFTIEIINFCRKKKE